MKVEYALLAQIDLSEIGEYSRRTFGRAVASALEIYIREMIARIAAIPENGEVVADRPNVRVVALVRYPFRIFYTAADDVITILHIRHTARRPWINAPN